MLWSCTYRTAHNTIWRFAVPPHDAAARHVVGTRERQGECRAVCRGTQHRVLKSWRRRAQQCAVDRHSRRLRATTAASLQKRLPAAFRHRRQPSAVVRPSPAAAHCEQQHRFAASVPSCDRRSPPAHSAHEQFSDNKPQRKSEQLPPLGRQAAQRQDASAPNLGPLGIGRYALAQRPQPAAPAAAPPRPQRQHTGAAQDGAPARGGVKRAPGSGAGPRSQPAGAHTPVKRFKVHFMESHGMPKRIAAMLMQHCATVGIHFPSSSRCILVVNLLADCQNWMPRTVPAAGILEHTAIEGAASSVEVSVRCRWAASPVTCAPATPMTFTPGSSSGQFSRFGRRAFALQMAPGSPPRVSSRSPAFTTSSRGTLMISPRGSGMQSPAVLCRTPAVRLPPVSRSQAAGTVMLRRQMLSLSSLPCWHAWRPLCCCRGAELIVIPALLPAAAHSCRQQCSNASRRDKPAAAC